jgi:hypothetical protein
MLGKCLWKMYCRAGDDHDPRSMETKPSMEDVLRAFKNAIKTVPKPNNRSEPILEPHYKIVSIVHKLLKRGDMTLQAAADLLQEQPYAVDKGERVTIEDEDDWEPFVLRTLRHLRDKDKQHWHHRMISRVANILYDFNEPDYVQASAARHEFRESIFTKTMHIMVWKPDSERPGRHCVYMERYVRFMINILGVLNDKTNMEALVRRVRKKSNEFHKFETVWTECCTSYLRLIRRTAEIPPGMDEVFKGVSTEEYEIFSDRLTAWIADPRMAHPALDALRETVDLKKLNSNAIKPAPIDDLINDCWAALYIQVAKGLPGPDPASLQESQTDGPPGAIRSIIPKSSLVNGPMSLNNLVMDMNGTQIPVHVTLAGSEPSRPRKIGISRREILRRAELAINRVPDPPRAIAPASARPRVSEPPSAMVLGSNAEPASTNVSTPRADAPATTTGPENEDGNESERGSLHDSADDESDLSDPPDMDDVDSSTIFPNLVRREGQVGSSGGEGASTPAKE